MFAYPQRVPVELFNRSRIAEDLYAIVDAFTSFARRSLVNDSRDARGDLLQLSQTQPSAEESHHDDEIHCFFSQLWRMSFEGARTWLTLFDRLGLAQAFQKPISVLTWSALAPLKHQSNLNASMPNLLFILRTQEELSRSFKAFCGQSWLDWDPSFPAALLTSLCDTEQVQSVEQWVHQHLRPLLCFERITQELPDFPAQLKRASSSLHHRQRNWQSVFPDVVIRIDRLDS